MEQEFTVLNPLGIHARPANTIVAKANAYPCEIILKKGEKKANAKSMVGILKLQVKLGDKVTVLTAGEQEEEAVGAIGAILETNME